MDRRDDGGGGGESAGQRLPATLIEVHASEFEPDLQHLEASGALALALAAAPLREVALVGFGGNDDDGNDNESGRRTSPAELRSLRLGYRRFVALVDRYGREPGIRSAAFAGIRFDARAAGTGRGAAGFDFPEADQALLFGEVLPSLPLLERVEFDNCASAEANLAMLASKLSPTNSLVELDVAGCTVDYSLCAPAIAAMIRRNVPLQVLKLNADQAMGKGACRQIFQSLGHNSNLRRLEVRVNRVHDDVPVLPPTSSIRSLRLDVENWNDKGKSSLAAQLRTNAVLEDLRVVRRTLTSLDHRPWIEMLESHNHTLRSLEEHFHGPLRARGRMRHETVLALLRRNGRIQQALEQLQGRYHVSRAVLLPNVLEMVSSLPTLLYRFVRRGDVNALGDLLLSRQRKHRNRRNEGGKKKRGRPQPPPALRRSVRVANDREKGRQSSRGGS